MAGVAGIVGGNNWRSGSGIPGVILTATQETQSKGVNKKRKKPLWGTPLWQLQEKERKKAKGGKGKGGSDDEPDEDDDEPDDAEGWEDKGEYLVHRTKSLQFMKATGQYYFYDGTKHVECEPGHEPTQAPIRLTIGVAKAGEARDVVIPELARTAPLFKATHGTLKLDHLDSPAALAGLYAGGEQALACARVFHTKLVPSLAGFVGQWTAERTAQAVAKAAAGSLAEAKLKHPSDPSAELAVLLVLGTLGLACWTPGCAVVHDGERLDAELVEGLRCSALELRPGQSIALHALHEPDSASMLDAWNGYPRAFARKLLGTGSGAVQVLCVSGEAPAKPAKEAPIRCRQLLLKHTAARRPVDNKRRKVTRTLADAESRMADLLLDLLEEPARWPQVAREVSECPSALKGGESAGDLGWIAKGRQAKEFDQAAFALQEHELSDVVTSPEGVHLIYRLA